MTYDPPGEARPPGDRRRAAGSDAVAAAILAAGRGSRFGGDESKPLLEWRGRPLVAWALAGAARRRAVPRAGRHRLPAVDVVDPLAPAGVDVVHSSRWEEGIAHSLHAALDALDGYATVQAVCVGLADQPRVGAEAYRRLAPRTPTARRSRSRPTTASGQPGPARRVASGPRPVSSRGDVGARALMQRHPVVEVACDDTGQRRRRRHPADLEDL